jgi:hypothetical protein
VYEPVRLDFFMPNPRKSFMSRVKRAALIGLFASSALLGVVAVAKAQSETYSSRQYYGGWQKHPSGGYHYRPYYYKPSPSYVGYKHHYVVLHPKRPKHLYYYNPVTKKYWGRCPVSAEGKAAYSMLAEKDRGEDLAKIPEASFPPPGPLPPVPDSSDGAVLDLPPNDLPPDLELAE